MYQMWEMFTKYLLYMSKSWHEVWKNVNEVWEDKFFERDKFVMDIIIKLEFFDCNSIEN